MRVADWRSGAVHGPGENASHNSSWSFEHDSCIISRKSKLYNHTELLCVIKEL